MMKQKDFNYIYLIRIGLEEEKESKMSLLSMCDMYLNLRQREIIVT